MALSSSKYVLGPKDPVLSACCEKGLLMVFAWLLCPWYCSKCFLWLFAVLGLITL